MSSSSVKTPPAISQSRTYEDRLNFLESGACTQNYQKKHQDAALVLFLEGEAQEAVLEIQNNESQ